MNATTELCQCCGETVASETDPHFGGVCIECAHRLDHAGRYLVSPVLMMEHPPRPHTVAFNVWEGAEK